MGDKKQPFTPSYAPILDNVIGKEFAPCTMRRCYEPHVIKKFGIGGIVNVSIYTCRKCKYMVKDEMFGGVGCAYKEQSKLE